MKNSIKKRILNRKQNMITVLVMHILLACLLVGCDNAGLMKDRESGYEGKAYYVNSLGIFSNKGLSRRVTFVLPYSLELSAPSTFPLAM